MQALALSRYVDFGKLINSWKPITFNLALICGGCIIFVIGMNSVLIPKQFLSGGLLGTAMIIHYLFPSMSTGVVYFFLNIPLAILGWFNISRRFMYYSIVGMTFFSWSASLIKVPAAKIDDPILAGIFAGAICGVGAGLILRSFGSAGGLDVLGIYLNKRFGIRIGSVIFAANASVLLVGALFFSLEMALHSIVYVFTSSKVIDAVLTGFNQRKSVLIVSDHASSIAQEILHKENRGVTFLKGQGAYSGNEKNVILSITTLAELAKMKDMVFDIDPDAFVVVNDTLEVLGRRHGKKRVY